MKVAAQVDYCPNEEKVSVTAVTANQADLKP
jgi:hypothetical protein